MTRKDYERIAAVIRSQLTLSEIMGESEDEPAPTLRELAKDFADMLANDNPRFDRERFLKACGL